jgi:hypothetical protein
MGEGHGGPDDDELSGFVFGLKGALQVSSDEVRAEVAELVTDRHLHRLQGGWYIDLPPRDPATSVTLELMPDMVLKSLLLQSAVSDLRA